jgi:glycosyltransferase involved in cell wall biosynthesis
MRICLVAHGFPPLERTGVENYTASLAGALAARGLEVEVFVPRVRSELPQLSVRRETQDGYGVTWITTNVPPRNPTEALDPPGVDTRFADFLDRERPDVVHFQHLVKLGVGLVDAARKRRIPTVYTAHDYYPVCHRYTLLRPDLERCATIGDSMVCARCDLAASFLNRAPGLGDYQMGALPEQLDEAARAGLRALLDEGEPGPAGMTHAELDAAFDRRQVLDGRRAEAYAALDCILAPTQFLAARLREGGIDPERLRVVPYGIDTAAPRLAAPILRGGRLRFGFLSGMSKHKGAHVLLDAFERLREPAELYVYGGSTDTPYVERVRRRAAEVGAVWRGPFDRGDLQDCLSAVDVVVVPSTWYENQPIVILEAFAAGRAGDRSAPRGHARERARRRRRALLLAGRPRRPGGGSRALRPRPGARGAPRRGDPPGARNRRPSAGARSHLPRAPGAARARGAADARLARPLRRALPRAGARADARAVRARPRAGSRRCAGACSGQAAPRPTSSS